MQTHLPIVRGADLDPFANDLLELIRNDSRQQRTEMHAHPTLMRACKIRIADMFKKDFFGHFVPGSLSPNDLVRDMDYRLPGNYPSGEFANSIEIIAGNQVEVEDVFDAWVESPDHAVLLFGEGEFYRRQTNVGLAHFYINGIARTDAITCMISAPPEPELHVYLEGRVEMPAGIVTVLLIILVTVVLVFLLKQVMTAH